ncbi:MAG: hypothetical protein IPK82_20835 [Polyangiaceae bacterium]|nr:hypothetical protein [Polyangiaceae bacterium]
MENSRDTRRAGCAIVRATVGLGLVLTFAGSFGSSAWADDLPPPPPPQVPNAPFLPPPPPPAATTYPSAAPTATAPTYPSTYPTTTAAPYPYPYPYPYPPPPGGQSPYVQPAVVDPAGAAYMDAFDEKQKRDEKEGFDKQLEMRLREIPEYASARARRIGSLIVVGIGGGVAFAGVLMFAVGSTRGCGIFSSCNPDEGAQAASGAFFALGAAGMIVAGLIAASAKSDMTRIRERFSQTTSKIQVNFGLGSISVGAKF